MNTETTDTKQFQKNVESFTCSQCGTFVEGNGYTNHCPECFASQHIDVNPGDRASACGGVMLPVEVWYEHSLWHITQKCQQCGFSRPNKVQENDNMEALAALQADIAGRIARGVL